MQAFGQRKSTPVPRRRGLGLARARRRGLGLAPCLVARGANRGNPVHLRLSSFWEPHSPPCEAMPPPLATIPAEVLAKEAEEAERRALRKQQDAAFAKTSAADAEAAMKKKEEASSTDAEKTR